MLQVGCAAILALLGTYALLTIPSALDARRTLVARDYCCDEDLQIKGRAYRLTDSSLTAINPVADIILRGKRRIDPKTDSIQFYREELQAHKRVARAYDRDGALRAGWQEASIDSFLKIEPDNRLKREYYTEYGSISRLSAGYAAALAASLSFILGLTCLWWWFGARRSR